MRVETTPLAGVLVLEPRVFRDARGFFAETWREERYAELGIAGPFVQDNLSFSRRGVLRGLHFQNPSPQGKLVGVLQGEIFDVAVDLRLGSPTFGHWVGRVLGAEPMRQMWVPEGFAHGFLVLSETALVSYKCTRAYAPQHEHGLRWDDPQLGIKWPLAEPILSEKDAAAPRLAEIPPEQLFRHAAGRHER